MFSTTLCFVPTLVNDVEIQFYSNHFLSQTNKLPGLREEKIKSTVEKISKKFVMQPNCTDPLVGKVRGFVSDEYVMQYTTMQTRQGVKGSIRPTTACSSCGEFVHIKCDANKDVLCTKCMEKNVSSASQNAGQRLHTEGFAIFRNAFTLEEDTVDMIYESRYFPIFNGYDGEKVTYDGKRIMAEGEWRSAFRKKLKYFLHKEGFMECAKGKKTVHDVYALRSLPGCPIQPKHSDSAAEESLRHEDPSNVPLAILYAIEPETKLKIWRFDNEFPCVVNLNATDLVIFRGDAAHAGYCYENVNTRLHAYIDSSAPGCKRIKGKTYILQDDKYLMEQ